MLCCLFMICFVRVFSLPCIDTEPWRTKMYSRREKERYRTMANENVSPGAVVSRPLVLLRWICAQVAARRRTILPWCFFSPSTYVTETLSGKMMQTCYFLQGGHY